MSALEGAGHSTDRRMRVVLGVITGVCVAVFTWFVTLGRRDLFGRAPLADLFDIQARSMLHGRLDAATGAYGFESFVIDGKTYTYFGVFPSLLRVPVLLATDSYDGRLTTVSMLLGYITALVAVAVVIVRIRRLARPDAPWTAPALAIWGTLLAVVGLGSNLFILSSAARVYYEAAMWGAAGVLVSFAAVLGFLLNPTRRSTILWAGLGAAVAWLSRGSVGLAPSIVLGLLGLTYLVNWRPLHALAPRSDSNRDRAIGAALLVAATLPALAFGAINTAKFGSPTAIPFDKMSSAGLWEHRVEVLDRYGGDMSSPIVAPAHLVQDFRPDLVGLDRVWPFIHLEKRQPPDIGDAFFDTVEPTAGLTVTAPALLVLGAIGAWGVVRRRDGLAPLRPFLLGGLVPVAIVASVAFVAQRYLTDIVPLLIVAAAAGVVVLEAAAERLRGRPPARRWVPLMAVGALALLGVYTSLSVTWVMQRFVTEPDVAALAAGLRTQQAAAKLPGVRGPQVEHVVALPRHGEQGERVVVGDCEGLYQAEETGWFAIESSPARGHIAVQLTLDGRPRRPAVLVATGSDDDYLVIGIESVEDGKVRLVADRSGKVSEGKPFDLALGRPHRIDVWADPAREVDVAVDGRPRYADFAAPPPALGDTDIGENPYSGDIEDTVPGTVIALDIPMPTCEALTDN